MSENNKEKQYLFDEKPIAFTTGALIKPMRVTNNVGEEFWIWRISEFIDDTYHNGDVVLPNEISTSDDEILVDINGNKIEYN